MFTGVATAIITPFKNGEIDIKSLEKIVQFQIDNKISAICPCGTTGEIATLTIDEYKKVIETVVKIAKGKAFILAGVGGNDTAKVIKNIDIATKCGADGVLCVMPYYNKPSQDGLIAHFSEISSNSSLPIMLYNVPSRTVTDISDDTIARLAAKCKNIVALKDASGNLERVALLRQKLKENNVNNFKIYSGDDITTLAYIAMGAVGLISVASNIIPKQCEEMVTLCLEQNFEKARILQDKYAKLFDAMFIDTNPAPVKFALSKLGFCDNELRLPLVKMNEKCEEIVEKTLKECNLL
ncbi:4-hydroxy-tetrahydrodipicolinate synthase [Candidatus Deianiraea vastatrix]|uniref:4-hydroxy-tetrahydrodipicolinate synthase n=1 Tax=Candidatus Deianiraea vastatrix TaxID=2163644 RepID=A0A5B8XC70_9RICK|nr:4-hydroxy-tetrahydrodipicolinate synthase [Candidatus Deianiraea vastatrix]QED22860.1 4-hydroxy-tetrahydrodipicolinate synthase [Candidatus Deianiraea vastatrix]